MDNLNSVVVLGKLNSIYYVNKSTTIILINLFKNGTTKLTIPIYLSVALSKSVKKHCKTNDSIGIRGSIAIRNEQLIIIADKIALVFKVTSRFMKKIISL